MKGSVPVHAFDRPVLLIGRENMNRAVQGDVVAVEIFDEKDWKAPGDAVVDQESALLVRRPVCHVLTLEQPLSRTTMQKTRKRKAKTTSCW